MRIFINFIASMPLVFYGDLSQSTKNLTFMKKISTLALWLISMGMATGAFAQLSCEYRLDLFDSFGDGWNGSLLTITIDGVPTQFTLDNIADDGYSNSFNIPVAGGSAIVLNYSPGFYENEVTYFLYDADGLLVFNDGPYPFVGQAFNFTSSCPSCPIPPLSGVSIDDVRAFYTDISWLPSDPNGTYVIEYDTAGFAQGTGSVLAVTGESDTRINGLQQHTAYQFYLSVVCENGDTSTIIGPFDFHTLWANDVGVISVTGPPTQCGLGASEIIGFEIQNFGGNPQSLITINMSVNGNPVNINQPLDGFYTGVLGKDSIANLEFEQTVNLSEPGQYVIAVWTELDGDSDLSNDTTYLTLYNIPTVAEYPYFINFEEDSGGWTAADYGQNSTWEFGIPAGTLINSAASGEYAWVTNLDGTYNNSELSYLVSPCLDFSSLASDPKINFSLFFEVESCCDEAWLESSIDGGQNWTKVGAFGTGINWYNDNLNNWWDGTGGFSGWVTASNILTGTAGQSSVRLRFVLSTDFSVVYEGMGVDNVFIAEPQANDLSAIGASNANTSCGSATDQVTIRVFNNGQLTQTGFDVGYQINGGAPVIENVGSLSVGAGQFVNYTFTTPFNSSVPDVYEIVVWTSLAGEQFVANDTTSTSFASARSVPFSENFEGGVFPAGWTIDTDVQITNFHSNVSFVMADNLWTADQVFQASTPAIGAIAIGDSLLFDYRFVDFSGNGQTATTLSTGEQFYIEISTNCGQSFTTILNINSTNHITSNQLRRISLPLDDYAGQAIVVRFRATWSSGDYYLDIDNINIKRCPASFDVTADVTGASSPVAQNGIATVIPGSGVAPYTYEWSDGQSSATAILLGVGTYTVTITDAVGCQDVVEVEVGIAVGTDDVADQIGQIDVMPNPTTGLTQLNVAFRSAVDARIQVVNLLGQPLMQAFERNVTSAQYQLDLSQYANGIYLVQIAVDNEVKTAKLVKMD